MVFWQKIESGYNKKKVQTIKTLLVEKKEQEQKATSPQRDILTSTSSTEQFQRGATKDQSTEVSADFSESRGRLNSEYQPVFSRSFGNYNGL